MRFVALLGAIVLVGAGCAAPQTARTDTSPKMPRYGISLTPRSFQGSDFTDFFSQAKQAGGIVRWAGSADELADLDHGAPAATVQLAAQYGLTPEIDTTPLKTFSLPPAYATSSTERTALIQRISAFVARYHPPVLGFGGEVNLFALKEPQNVDAFVSLFDDVVAAVHEASPQTKVLVSFQLEMMRGGGGLFGTSHPAQWDLLKRFDHADLIAFTSYPGLIYKDPADIPDDYYTSLSSHTDKPMVIVELGWQASTVVDGWESSPDTQARFLKRFGELTKGTPLQFILYAYLYDQPVAKPFNTMGLFQSDGSPRPAWHAWQTLVSPSS